MASPNLIAITTYQNGSGTSVTLTLPARSTGDLLIAVVDFAQNNSVTWPSDWKAIDGCGYGIASSYGMAMAYRFVDGSETDPTVTVGTGTPNGYIIQYGGVYTTPIGSQVQGYSAAGAGPLAASFNTVSNDSTVVAVSGYSNNALSGSATGFTTELDIVHHVVADQAVAAKGTAVDYSQALTGGANWTTFLIELQSVAGDSPPPSLNETAAWWDKFSGTNTHNFTYNSFRSDAMILIGIHMEGSGTPVVSTITDTAGLTWTKRGSVQWSGAPADNSLELWYAQTTQPVVSDSITITTSASVDDASFVVFEASKFDQTTPWDPNAGVPASATDTTGNSVTPTVTGISTTNAADLILALWGCGKYSNGVPTDPADMTLVESASNGGGSNQSVMAAWQKTVSAALSNATETWGGTSVDFGVMVDALQSAASVSASLSSLQASIADDNGLAATIEVLYCANMSATFTDDPQITDSILIELALQSSVADDGGISGDFLPGPFNLAALMIDGDSVSPIIQLFPIPQVSFSDDGGLTAGIIAGTILEASITDEAEFGLITPRCFSGIGDIGVIISGD